MIRLALVLALSIGACQSIPLTDDDTTHSEGTYLSDGAEIDVSINKLDSHSAPAVCEPQTGSTCTPGKFIKSFSLMDCNGTLWNIQELLRSHKKALFYFTANWFQPMNSNPITQLERWHEEFGKDIRFVAILREDQGITSPATLELCQNWTQKNDVTFLVLIDPKNELTGDCLDERIPTALAVDCDGTVYFQSELLPVADPGTPPI